MKRGYSEKKLQVTINEVLEMQREDLLQDKSKEKKDPNIIFVSLVWANCIRLNWKGLLDLVRLIRFVKLGFLVGFAGSDLQD